MLFVFVYVVTVKEFEQDARSLFVRLAALDPFDFFFVENEA